MASLPEKQKAPMCPRCNIPLNKLTATKFVISILVYDNQQEKYVAAEESSSKAIIKCLNCGYVVKGKTRDYVSVKLKE